MSELLECLEIASGPAPEVQDRERWRRLDVLQQPAMFWLTLWSRVPSQNASARWL
jgi:hypothetical protein